MAWIPPPTTRRVQVLEEVMLSHHMERLKPMLTAGSDIGWIIRRTWKRATEQVCQLPRRWSARENKDGNSGFGGLICFTTNDACWRLVSGGCSTSTRMSRCQVEGMGRSRAATNVPQSASNCGVQVKRRSSSIIFPSVKYTSICHA
jgi:hypothetical protein